MMSRCCMLNHFPSKIEVLFIENCLNLHLKPCRLRQFKSHVQHLPTPSRLSRSLSTACNPIGQCDESDCKGQNQTNRYSQTSPSFISNRQRPVLSETTEKVTALNLRDWDTLSSSILRHHETHIKVPLRADCGLFSPCSSLLDRHRLGLLQNSQIERLFSTASNSDLSLSSSLLTRYLDSLCERYVEADKVLRGSSGVAAERATAGQTLQRVRGVVEAYRAYKARQQEKDELKDIIHSGEDTEMVQMARQELQQIEEELEDLEAQVLALVAPPQRADHTDVVLEVTAGVGGDEAKLFAEELFKMYENFSAYKGWSFGVVQYDENEAGGIRHASAEVSSSGGEEGVYGLLKLESGVHRVQRVPRTEKAGRMHTSTVTVSVLPQPTEIDIEIDKKDLRVDVFKASGAGGQHVNKTESAVRITHTPSGMVVECQVNRSQIKNRETALKILRSRLYERELEEQQSALRSQKKVQIGTAARSEKIRTYNFNQDRVTDHRIGGNRFNVDGFLEGSDSLEELLDDLTEVVREDELLEVLERFRLETDQKKSR